MSESIHVSGGASVAVATEAMDEAFAECSAIVAALRGLLIESEALTEPQRRVQTRSVVTGEQSAALLASAAAQRLDSATLRLDGARAALRTAVEVYTAVETALARARSVGGELSGYGLGVLAAFAPGALLPMAALVLLPAAARATESVGEDASADDLIGAILADEAVIDLVRGLSGSLDEFAQGAAGLPLPLAVLMGDHGTGALGHQAVAGEILGALVVAGVLQGGAIALTQSAAGKTAAPKSIEQLVSRIPREGDDQIRVDVFTDSEGRTQGVVYLGGTKDTAGQPWDMTSNVAAVAGEDAGSIRATEAAMRRAGLGPDDPIVFVGYSQGGLVASRLIESGDWNAAALVTAGSPGGAIPVPDGLPVIALEHDEDFIVALGGVEGRSVEERATAVVSRPILDDAPGSGMLPGHDFAAYRQTAALGDASSDPALVAIRQQVLTPLAAAGVGTTSMWTATRVSGDAPREVAAPAR